MTAERDSMTLNEVSVPALGVERVATRPPGPAAPEPTPDPEVVAKPKRRQVHRRVSAADSGGGGALHTARRGAAWRREGLYSSHLTAWRRSQPKGSLPESTAKKHGANGRSVPHWVPGCARSIASHRHGHDCRRAAAAILDGGKIAGLAGSEPRTRTALLIGSNRLRRRSAWRLACQALGVSLGDLLPLVRGQLPVTSASNARALRALCEAEREQVLDVTFAGPRFVDRAPAEVVATLLEAVGHYPCSGERRLYRILRRPKGVRESASAWHPAVPKPAWSTAPNRLHGAGTSPSCWA